jgi:hypothetical protein
LSCLCTQLQDRLQFIQCHCVHALKNAERGFLCRCLQMFALVSSAPFTIEVHSELSPTLAGVLLARLCHWVLYVLVVLQKLLLGIFSWWHNIQISATLAPVSSISGIPVLGRPRSWCTRRITACFAVLHSTAHKCGRVANFTDTTSAEWELTLNTLRKAKYAKPLCPTHVSSKSLSPIKTWRGGQSSAHWPLTVHVIRDSLAHSLTISSHSQSSLA